MLPIRPASPAHPSARAGRPLVVTAVLTGALAACSSGAGPAPVPAPPPPPAPPAACLLDTAALETTTGLRWAPDASTASDTRCVYDPVDAPRPEEGPAFVAVDVTEAPDPAAALDTVAELCEDGSLVPVGAGADAQAPTGDAGPGDTAAGDTDTEDTATGDTATGDTGGATAFVCRFQGGSVYAAAAQDDRVVTLSASAVPEGTTAARLVVAFDQQMTALS